MTHHAGDQTAAEQPPYGKDATQALLDQLLEDARLYKTSKDYKELLDFIVRLPNFAPFNAMLLQLQKPGLQYAASAWDWKRRFNRYPKEGARPLLILWPFGPIALVYDVQDTEGGQLPEDVSGFVARGAIDDDAVAAFECRLDRRHITVCLVDAGDANAGLIRVVRPAKTEKEWTQYCICVNRNHTAPVKFTTLAHELGHLTLGHLGPDQKLGVPSRSGIAHAQRELEAESVAYIVCKRNGVEPKSYRYLAQFVTASTTSKQLDIYQIMRAAGQVETMLGLAVRTQFGPSPSRTQEKSCDR